MSHPFERILLATEHTEFDTGSERVAFALAQSCHIPLMAVMPVVSNPVYESVAPELAERHEQEAVAMLQELRNAAANCGVQLIGEARRGEEPYREIVEQAIACKANLIVTRRRGKRSFLSNLLIGEMIVKVVAHAPCHVLLVPRAAQMWSHGILAAVDSSISLTHVVNVASRIARQCTLPLTIVSVAGHDSMRPEAEHVLSRALALASASGVQARGRILTGKPFEQILAAAKLPDADLIIMGRHGESNLIRTPFGGTTQKVVALADIPVLVVHL